MHSVGKNFVPNFKLKSVRKSHIFIFVRRGVNADNMRFVTLGYIKRKLVQIAVAKVVELRLVYRQNVPSSLKLKPSARYSVGEKQNGHTV